MKSIRKIINTLLIVVIAFISVSAFRPGVSLAAPCSGGSLLGLPSWYAYLDCTDVGGRPTPTMDADKFLPNLLLIGMAIIELLLKLSGILAIGYVVWGGIKYTTSQGSPEGTKSARETIAQALVGLVIILLATSLVATVARIISKGYN